MLLKMPDFLKYMKNMVAVYLSRSSILTGI